MIIEEPYYPLVTFEQPIKGSKLRRKWVCIICGEFTGESHEELKQKAIKMLKDEIKTLEETKVKDIYEEYNEVIHLLSEKEKESEEIIKENQRLSKEWQECHDWNNKVIAENQRLKSKIRELTGEKETLFKKIAKLIKI